MTIGVTGATGGLGGRVARALAERGARQRLLVRDAARAPDLPGAEVAVAEYADRAAMHAALLGVRTLLLVSAHEGPGRVDLHRGVVAAASSAGVERVVYTSFLGAAPRASFPYAVEHHRTELLVRGTDMALTALRPSLYADIVPTLVGADDLLRAPAGDGRVAWVSRHDLAAVAVACLLDDAHAGHAYAVTGPEPLDLETTCAVLSRACGRKIAYVAETEHEARRSRGADQPDGPPDWELDGWVGSYLAIASGELAITSHTVRALTGREPRTLAETLAAEPDLLAPPSPTCSRR